MLLHVVRSCCTISETSQTFLSHVQTDATTPKIVGPTLLGVVVSICTLFKSCSFGVALALPKEQISQLYLQLSVTYLLQYGSYL